MFGRRADGKIVKGMQIIDKAMPYFMPERIDADNRYTQEIRCEGIDKFVQQEKARSGVHYSYTEIIIAACVRMLYERPKTNRFISNCKVYQRNHIAISLTVKKRLTDDGEELTLKFFFTGRESLPQIKKIVDDEIAKNIANEDYETHKTTKTAGFLCKLPGWMFKLAMCLVRFLDRHEMLPKALIDASPFHTSLFFSDLRSIKMGKVYHHIYNFGTTTIFSTLGKVKYVPVAERTGEIHVEKQMDLGFTLDERVCDGLYYANSVRSLVKNIEDPSRMMEPLPEPKLSEKEEKRQNRVYKRKLKKEARITRRTKKKEQKTQKKAKKKK